MQLLGAFRSCCTVREAGFEVSSVLKADGDDASAGVELLELGAGCPCAVGTYWVVPSAAFV